MLLLHTYTFSFFFNWELQERLSNMAHDILNSLRAAGLTECVLGITKKQKKFWLLKKRRRRNQQNSEIISKHCGVS